MEYDGNRDISISRCPGCGALQPKKKKKTKQTKKKKKHKDSTVKIREKTGVEPWRSEPPCYSD